MKRLLITFFLTAMFSTQAQAQAQAQNNDYCPQKIAAFANGIAAKAYSRILVEVYQKLGCEPEIIFLPAKRSITAFNRGDVDGELYRLSVTESKYGTDFVRSNVPLYIYRAGIWENPTTEIADTRPLGFVRGMTWQVSYANKNPQTRSVQFNAPSDAIEAYQRQSIGSFLSGEPMMKARMHHEKIFPQPVLKDVLIEKPIYHYLHKRYAKFMTDFSDEVTRSDPFAKVAQYFD